MTRSESGLISRLQGRVFTGLTAAIFCLYVAMPQVLAQAGGSVTGRVTDQTEALIPGVTVELLEAGAATPRETFTEGDGTYRFDNVPAGPVTVTFRLINFATVRREITVTEGGAATADAVLYVAASADITITAPRTFRNLAELDRPAENLVGVAVAGSEGAITAEQLEDRPIMRAGEVLETVPGLIVSQHSGEGKANQYYLRGFNLDHGFDFATTFVAGIPVNMPTHAHAHGYADANFLIPELVSGVQFRKGPYYAERGDFSAAGSASINYFNRLDRPIVTLSGGGLGWRRFFGAASPELAGGYLLAAIELNQNDGPWERPDDYGKVNGVLRYSRGDTRNGFSITGMAYAADWNSTDQVAKRAIDGGLIGRFGSLHPSDEGDTYRYSVAADFQRSGTNDSTRVIAYAQRYAVRLVANFTYYLNDPVNGDQIEQSESRWVTGGSVTHRRLGQLGDYHTESAFGMEFRNDSIAPLGLYRTVEGRRLSTIREDDVDQFSVGMFAQTQIEWSPVVRTTFGLRGDVFHYNVRSDNPLNSGIETSGIVSPKATVVFGPWSGTEVYVNGGLGFHSNSGLGATLTVNPVTGEPAERSTPIVRAPGAEVGVRTVRVPGLQTTATLWILGFDSELLFVGDEGTTEAGRPSRRYGVEITNYAVPLPWLRVDLDVSFSRARFTDRDPAGDFIPGSLDRVISAGAAIDPGEDGTPGPFGSLRLRHFGPRPLVEDNSVQSQSTSIVNGELGYRFNDQLRLVLEAFNIFDAEVSDIDYYYTSRLPGEPALGVDDIHLHPALPRSARVSLQMSF